jgi:hypothetical protein
MIQPTWSTWPTSPTRFPAAKNKIEVKNEKNMGLLIFVDIYTALSACNHGTVGMHRHTSHTVVQDQEHTG